MKFIVDRQTWHRGKNFDDYPSLLNSQGKKCCLGFLALACGYTEEEIRHLAYPNDLQNRSKLPAFLIVEKQFDSCIEAEEIGKINDNSHLSDDWREKRLKDKFAQHNTTIEFIN